MVQLMWTHLAVRASAGVDKRQRYAKIVNISSHNLAATLNELPHPDKRSDNWSRCWQEASNKGKRVNAPLFRRLFHPVPPPRRLLVDSGRLITGGTKMTRKLEANSGIF